MRLAAREKVFAAKRRREIRVRTATRFDCTILRQRTSFNYFCFCSLAFVFSALLEFTIVNYMWRKLQPELLKKIVSIPEHVHPPATSNAVSVKQQQDVCTDNDRAAGLSANDFAVAVTVVRYFTKRQVKIYQVKRVCRMWLPVRYLGYSLICIKS